MFRTIMNAVTDELHTGLCLRDLTNRWACRCTVPGPGMRKAGHLLKQRYEENGATGAEMIAYPADDRTEFLDGRKNPLEWQPRDAQLSVVRPASAAGAICRYQEEPICLVCNSTGTPPGGVDCEVVVHLVAAHEHLRLTDGNAPAGDANRGAKAQHGTCGHEGGSGSAPLSATCGFCAAARLSAAAGFLRWGNREGAHLQNANRHCELLPPTPWSACRASGPHMVGAGLQAHLFPHLLTVHQAGAAAAGGRPRVSLLALQLHVGLLGLSVGDGLDGEREEDAQVGGEAPRAV
ncbi:MAG: hypothetical protein COZ06_26975 [Armatimonadetes bacterium CG_4_10_14_3_um_filter_66_18]|nr:hypothetical protein [Armatimonadota bacterium]PIY41209.1 MAG: hypothetical protein COZ06_26975 [Armatimonadetes bacterium CG_4_10_14_3_um_filter_66_18]